MINIKNEKGFTFIELLIAMTIFVTFCASAYAMLFSMTKASDNMKKSSDELTSVRVCMDFIASYLYLADSFSVSVKSPSGATTSTYTASTEDFSGQLYLLKVKISDTSSNEIKIFEFKQNYKNEKNVIAFGGNDFDNYKLQVLGDIDSAYVSIDKNKILTITLCCGSTKLTKKIDISYKSVASISETIVE